MKIKVLMELNKNIIIVITCTDSNFYAIRKITSMLVSALKLNVLKTQLTACSFYHDNCIIFALLQCTFFYIFQ